MSSLAEKSSVIAALCSTNNPVIVELGAHVGEEAAWFYALKPSRYVMVEPDPQNCGVILDKLYTPALIQAVVAASNGSRKFYASYNSKSINRASGSIRRPTGHLIHFPEVTFSETQVNCLTLDAIASQERLGHIDLLWCDIQGAERDMIEGGRATLAKTHYMMIEAEPEVELYEGQALKPELIEMLPDWEIIQDFGYNLFMVNRKFNA